MRGAFDAYEGYKEIVNDPYHPIWQEIQKRIEQYSPDLLGITIVFSATLKSAGNIAKMVKQYDNKIKVMVGGPHATLVSRNAYNVTV